MLGSARAVDQFFSITALPVTIENLLVCICQKSPPGFQKRMASFGRGGDSGESEDNTISARATCWVRQAETVASPRDNPDPVPAIFGSSQDSSSIFAWAQPIPKRYWKNGRSK